jgi:hypothetical protein
VPKGRLNSDAFVLHAADVFGSGQHRSGESHAILCRVRRRKPINASVRRCEACQRSGKQCRSRRCTRAGRCFRQWKGDREAEDRGE